MYFEDLTPYTYDGATQSPFVLNVGWLSSDRAFETGSVCSSFRNALSELASNPVNLHRGIHLCEFCPKPKTYVAPNGMRILDPEPGTSGNGEIRVTGPTGVTYVAPNLVAHYVNQHRYKPPQEFIDAVLSNS